MTGCFSAGVLLKLNVLILLYFLFTQRQYEMVHLRFSHWTFVALKKSIFDFEQKYEHYYMEEKKEKNTMRE